MPFRKMLVGAMLLASASSLLAEKPEILGIRKLYREVNDKVALCSDPASSGCPYYLSRLVDNEGGRQAPASGRYRAETLFFWDLDVDAREVVRKIHRTSELGEWKYHTEYLYDESGPVFVFRTRRGPDGSDGSKEGFPDLRLYFKDGKLVEARPESAAKISDELFEEARRLRMAPGLR